MRLRAFKPTTCLISLLIIDEHLSMTGLGKIRILCALLLSIAAVGTASAHSARSETVAALSVSSFVLHPASQETEKLISNVKVFYSPVAEQITLNFTLSRQNTVVIKVMDALGNEVLNLLNGRLDAGLQSLSFDAEGKLTKGFYFVRVSSGSETVVKRISVK